MIENSHSEPEGGCQWHDAKQATLLTQSWTNALAGADPKAAFQSDSLLNAMKEALAEPALNAEIDHHLAGEDAGNIPNGYGRKTVTTDTGSDRAGDPA